MAQGMLTIVNADKLRKPCMSQHRSVSCLTLSRHRLHPLQVRILQRGLNLLKDDGLLVYSTCSFNPLENEAVVAEAIRRSKGACSLIGDQ